MKNIIKTIGLIMFGMILSINIQVSKAEGVYEKIQPQKELEKTHNIDCMCEECIPSNELYDKYVEYAEKQKDGDWIFYLVDGSTVRINKELKEYELYTKELGDWETSFDTEKYLIMGIQTYIDCSGDFE